MTNKSPNDSLQLGLSFEIKVGGVLIPKEYVVMKIAVRSQINKISKASISILGGNTYENKFPESEFSGFEPGKEITISLGYNEKNSLVFSGIILNHKLSITEGYLSLASRSLIILEAADKAIKLTLEPKSDLYEKKKDSEILNAILASGGVSKEVETTTLTNAFTARHHRTDWQFSLDLAARNGMLVLNHLGKVIIKKPKFSNSESATIIYGKDPYSFRAELNAQHQLQQVESTSFDVFEEKESKQSGSEPQGLNKPGTLDGKKLGKVISPVKWNKSLYVPHSKQFLKLLADSELIKSRMKRVLGEMTFRGMNTIFPGTLVKLDGFGKLFNGLVFISSVEHKVENGEYVTKASFGLDEGFLSGKLKPSQEDGSISGIHVGIVKKIDGDPEKKNRIQVMIPSLKATGNGIWCSLGHFFASSNAGSFFVPELNSEVILGFLNGNPEYPVVLGSLYSKLNKPKEAFAKDNPIKSIVSKQGISLEFNEKEKAFKITTPGKNKLSISDQEKGVKIEDQNGNLIQLSDAGITISSKKDIKLNAKGKIQIAGVKGGSLGSSAGDVAIDGKGVKLKGKAKVEVQGSAGVDVKSSAVVNIKGSMVNVN